MENIKTIVLGNEYDDVLKKKIKSFFIREGINVDMREGGLAGSQEYQLFTFKYKNTEVKIEIETYNGISITGEKGIIENIHTELNNSLD